MASKPAIETMINSAALAMFSFGVVLLTTQYDGWECLVRGLVLLGIGSGLEFFKYWGRRACYW